MQSRRVFYSRRNLDYAEFGWEGTLDLGVFYP